MSSFQSWYHGLELCTTTENYVINILQEQIFNDDVIPQLVKELNDYQNSLIDGNKEEIDRLNIKVFEVSKQIDNIVLAISNGFNQSSFLDKMESLEEQKLNFDIQLKELQPKQQKTVITEEILRQLFSMFKDFVAEKTIPEIKKFIQSYVDKVIVYNDYVDVIFKLKIVDLVGGDEAWQFKSTIRRGRLIRLFGEVA